VSTISPSDIPAHALSDGTTIPQLGFGVWQVPDDQAETAVAEAFRVGYRHIDTAAIYGNEKGVGRAIAASDLSRDELYIVTKLWNSKQGYDTTLEAFDKSMGRLGLDALDLYLIHWAAPPLGKYVDTWKAFVTLHEQGRVASIGVSNFHQAHLEDIIEATGVTPVINQIELHPYLQQSELRAFDAAHGIATEAWSPLGSGHGLLDDPVLTGIADRLSCTSAQVVLAWHLALGNVVIPKSVTPSRISENLASVTVTLTPDDMAAIAGLDRGHRYGSDPETATFV
jgi:2,5-diketo-D-gluconate reductase A